MEVAVAEWKKALKAFIPEIKCSGLKWQIPILHTTYCPKLVLIWAMKHHHTVCWDNEKNHKNLSNITYWLLHTCSEMTFLFCFFVPLRHITNGTVLSRWARTYINTAQLLYTEVILDISVLMHLNLKNEHKQLSVVEDVCISRTQEAGIWGIKIWVESAWLLHTPRVCFKGNK